MKNERKKINSFSGLTELAVSDDELDNVTGGGYGGICTERGCTWVSENTCYYPTPCSKLCIGPKGECTCSDGIRGTFLKLLF